MASVRSNLQSVRAGLRRLLLLANPNGPGLEGKTLAEDVQELVAWGLHKRYVEQSAEPSGAPLAELKPATVRRKRRRGYAYPEKPLVATGLMTSAEQLAGEMSVTGHDIELVYGRVDLARREMGYATRGYAAGNRPPRPGYELDAALAESVGDLYERAMDERLRRYAGGF